MILRLTNHNILIKFIYCYDDFDVFKSSLEDFRHEVTKAGLDAKLHCLAQGETYNFLL